MKWTPEQVDRMTIAGFHAALGGYIRAHTTETEEAPSREEYLAVLAEEIAAGRA